MLWIPQKAPLKSGLNQINSSTQEITDRFCGIFINLNCNQFDILINSSGSSTSFTQKLSEILSSVKSNWSLQNRQSESEGWAERYIHNLSVYQLRQLSSMDFNRAQSSLILLIKALLSHHSLLIGCLVKSLGWNFGMMILKYSMRKDALW